MQYVLGVSASVDDHVAPPSWEATVATKESVAFEAMRPSTTEGPKTASWG